MTEEISKLLYSTFVEYGIPLISVIITTLASRALTAFRLRLHHEVADRMIDRAERLVGLAIEEVEVSLVADLKKAAEDGRITAEEATGARIRACNQVKKMLGQRGVADIRETVQDVDAMLQAMVEKKVRELRAQQGGQK